MTVTTGPLTLDPPAVPPIRAESRHRLILATSAALFGSAFAPAQVAVEHLSPWGAVLVRFGVASLVMLPFCLWAPAPSDDPVSERHRRDVLIAGLIAGAVNTIGFLVISFALERTTASNTAFLSSLSVVIVPVVAAVAARRVLPRALVAGVALAVAGSFLLSGATLDVGVGDALAIGDAFIASTHILTVAHFAPRLRPMAFNLAQLAVSAALAVPLAMVGGLGTFTVGSTVAAVYCGVAQAAALGLQVAAQAKVEATSAALILVLVPVFGAGVAFVFLGERLGLVGALGALLIIGAVLVAEVLPARRAAADLVIATPVP